MSKKICAFVTMAVIVSMMVPVAFAVNPKKDADSITAGEVVYSAGHYLAGEAIPTGFDAYGYNYQGHMFSGLYYNSYAGGAGFPVWNGDDESYLTANLDAALHWAWPYREVKLAMKWNDAWLSNLDRNQDGALDRHWGFDSYIGSGAWLTNHQSGENEDGTQWNFFTKIVAAPADAYVDSGVWYTLMT